MKTNAVKILFEIKVYYLLRIFKFQFYALSPGIKFMNRRRPLIFKNCVKSGLKAVYILYCPICTRGSSTVYKIKKNKKKSWNKIARK